MPEVMREIVGQIILGQDTQALICQQGLELGKLVCNGEGFRNLHEGRGQPDEISDSSSMAFLLLFPVATSLPSIVWPSC